MITKIVKSSDENIIISTDKEGFFGQFEISLDEIIDMYNKYEPKYQCKCCKEFFFSQQLEGDKKGDFEIADAYCSCNWLEKCDTNHCDKQSPHREWSNCTNHIPTKNCGCEEESK